MNINKQNNNLFLLFYLFTFAGIPIFFRDEKIFYWKSKNLKYYIKYDE